VTSTIQTQCSIAPGCALAQKRHGGDGITILTFGDAGTAEGDFHVGLNWATQPVFSLPDREDLGVGTPLLFICTNNLYGISTDYDDVHGQKNILEIARGYGMEGKIINGNDVEESMAALQEAMDYCRKERKPYFLEAMVSRLNGHSSSSGANRVDTVDSEKDYVRGQNEVDPILVWHKKLVKQKVVAKDYFDKKHKEETDRMNAILKEVKKTPAPTGDLIYDHTFTREIAGRPPQMYE
jgi:2-oxoisovalerate dehydrogenase E1 component alpha subunit